jgi:hypothetical protein
MEVGREGSNLNKSLSISCLQNNRQKHSGQVICVSMTVELYSQEKNKTFILYVKQQKHLIILNKLEI